MGPVTSTDTAAMDDTAAWAVANMPVRQPANRADDATIQRCFDNLQSALHPARTFATEEADMAEMVRRSKADVAESEEIARKHEIALAGMQRIADGYTQLMRDIDLSLAHLRLTPTQQAEREQLLSRAKFLKAEAQLMADEQWAEYAQDIYLNDGVRIKRSNQFDAQGCDLAWQIQDPEGFKLYHQLLHRAECAEASAEAIKL